MITKIVFKGPLITDTSIEGERKADGVIPAHPGGGALRLSKNTWAIFFATLDEKGFDLNRSILYQIRKNAPDGPLVREAVLAQYREDWDPFARGDRFVKSCGMPIAFGVPKGALWGNRLRVNQNVFVVKWYRLAHLRCGPNILNPLHDNNWPEGPDIAQRTLRIEWAQFRLNKDEDDIEIILKPKPLCQIGYEDGDAYTSLGPNISMQHSMKAPVPTNNSCTEWVEVDTFVPYGKRFLHGNVAVVSFCFNPDKRIYEWKKTGRLLSLDGRIIGESCINRFGKKWFISTRSFAPDGATCWFCTENPFESLGEPMIKPNVPSPRMSFLCADKVLRLFTNDTPRLHNSRNPLCCWDIDQTDCSSNVRHVIMDSVEQQMPFVDPFVDMAKLCPPNDNRQLLFYRIIAERQTGHNQPDFPVSEKEHEQAGIYYSEIHYDNNVADPWQFQRKLPANHIL